MNKVSLLSFLLFLFFTSTLLAQTQVEEVKEICTGLQPSEKPLVAIMPFKIGVQNTGREVGTGMTDVMMDALTNSGCFRVVERDQLNQIMQEQNLGISGAGDESSFAQVGKLAGAQIMIFGTITEFTEKESGAGGGVIGLLGKAKNKLGLAKVGSVTSHIGYTLRFVDPSTGILLASKAFSKNKTSIGAAGAGFGDGKAAGGGFYKSKSMQEALDESLREATEYMSENKSSYMSAAGNNNTQASSNNATKNTSINNDCPILKAAKKPNIVVIVPEEHVSGEGGNYNPYSHSININYNYEQDGLGRYISTAPCEAAETAIGSGLSESGFHLKDAEQLEELKKQSSYKNAFKNSDDAAKMASRYQVDMIIVGEAFSEYSKKSNGFVSCRARLDVKAIMRNDASIIATKSFTASGLDASELIAGKKALEAAGSKMADYLQQQFCSRGDDIISAMNMKEQIHDDNTESVNNSNATHTKISNDNGGNDNNQSASDNDISDRKAHDTNLLISGLTYDQSESLTTALKKMKAITSVSTDGYTLGQTKYKVNTYLNYHELIDNIKKWDPKLKYIVQMASDQQLMMIITEDK